MPLLRPFSSKPMTTIPGEDLLLENRLVAGDAGEKPTPAQLAELKQQQIIVEQGQRYVALLLAANGTREVSVHEVLIPNSGAFRALFLQLQLAPLVDSHLTVALLMRSIDEVMARFVHTGAIQPRFWVDLPGDPYRRAPGTPISVSPVLHIEPVKRLFAQTGTNIGNGEGDLYITGLFKNIFGGAEVLTVDASMGTRTKLLYVANYSQPIANLAHWRLDSSGFVNTTTFDWGGYQSSTRGVLTTIKHWPQVPLPFARTQRGEAAPTSILHEATVLHQWRRLQNVALQSTQVWQQLGDDAKLLLMYAVLADSRNSPQLPTAGKLLKVAVEAAAGPFQRCKHPYVKQTVQYHQGFTLLDSVLVLVLAQSGVLVPLNGTSSVLDRFYTGGANSVRGFALNGIGPQQQGTPLGGDVMVAGGVSVFLRVPYTGVESNFKLHLFVNAARLVPWAWVQNKLTRELVSGLGDASILVGVGVVYNHERARFEGSVSLPLQAAASEDLRKGFQFGVGVSFL